MGTTAMQLSQVGLAPSPNLSTGSASNASILDSSVRNQRRKMARKKELALVLVLVIFFFKFSNLVI
jgi:hypothetical protein